MNTKHEDNALLEQRGLRLSAIGALGMAALGIGFSFPTGSEAVLLDGLFSLIGFAVGLVAMRVAALVARPDDESFHFGYAAYEPMLNMAKGLLIAFVTLFAFISAIGSIFDGGREVEGSMAVVYALIAGIGCLVIAFTLRSIGRRTNSPLLEVDAKNWLMDGLISGAVAVAFGIVVLLKSSSFASWVPYTDPAIVILLVLLTLPIPVQIIRANWNQLLGRAPNLELQNEARQRVDQALASHPGLTPHIRLLETGRHAYVQLYITLGEEAKFETIDDLDRLRSEIHNTVAQGDSTISLDVIFTRDPRWTARSLRADDNSDNQPPLHNVDPSPDESQQEPESGRTS